MGGGPPRGGGGAVRVGCPGGVTQPLPCVYRQRRGRAIARLETAQAITGILTEAAALQAFSTVIDDIDADPWLLNCANGTLDLRTMELREHNPDDLITKIARAAYTPTADGATWTRFLARVLPDPDVCDYLQRLTGLSLLGKVNGDKQVAPIMTGPGATLAITRSKMLDSLVLCTTDLLFWHVSPRLHCGPS